MTKNHSDRKKLSKRLRGFRAIMGDDFQNLDAALVARIDETAEALETPIRIVIAGLSDANHHGLASILAGTPLVEDAKAALKCPRLDMIAGDEAKTATTVGGRHRTFRGCVVDRLVSVGAAEPIRLELPGLMIPHLEISVLPVYESQEDRAGYLLDLVADSAIIVWCSQATVPWHANERRLWFTVPDDLKTRSILALIHDGDGAAEAMDEKRRMVSDEFGHVVAVDTGDAATFAQGDGCGLIDALEMLIDADDAPMLDAARALRDELNTIPLGTGQAVPIPIPGPPLPASATDADPVDSLRTLILRDARACIASVEGMTDDDAAPVFEAMGTLMSGLSDALNGGVTLPRDHAALLAETAEAADLIGLLSYEGGTQAVQEAADMLRQITIDILDRLDGEAAVDASEDTDLRRAS